MDSTRSTTTEKQEIGVVIFDLDGTLTVPVLDFDAIRTEIGITPGKPILEALPDLPPDQRRRAELILEGHEETAARESCLHPGAAETVAELRRLGALVAILTRNARQWATLVLKKHDVVVDFLYTRDDGVVKPSPQPVLDICGRAGKSPRDSWMVGDYLFDIQSGSGAGCRTVLMVGDRSLPPFADQADHVITNLPDLVPLVFPGASLTGGQ